MGLDIREVENFLRIGSFLKWDSPFIKENFEIPPLGLGLLFRDLRRPLCGENWDGQAAD
jgi:hypothetical protein